MEWVNMRKQLKQCLAYSKDSISVSSHTTCVTGGRMWDLTEPLFPHLQREAMTASTVELLQGLNKVRLVSAWPRGSEVCSFPSLCSSLWLPGQRAFLPVSLRPL